MLEGCSMGPGQLQLELDQLNRRRVLIRYDKTPDGPLETTQSCRVLRWCLPAYHWPRGRGGDCSTRDASSAAQQPPSKARQAPLPELMHINHTDSQHDASNGSVRALFASAASRHGDLQVPGPQSASISQLSPWSTGHTVGW